MAHPTIEPTAFENSEDIKTARRELERLSAGARSAETASKRCQQTVNDVKRLLEPSSLPEYKFKTSKRIRADASLQNESPIQKGLSNFANLVYNDTHVAFSYATPEASPESEDNIVVNHKRSSQLGDNIVVNHKRPQQPSEPQQLKKQPVKQTDMHVTSLPRSAGDQSTPRADALPQPQPQLQNGHMNASTPSKSTPKAFVLPATLTPAQRAEYRMVSPRATPKVFTVPATLTPAQRAEYEKVTLPEARESTPSRNQSAYLTNGTRAGSLGQRQKSDQAVENMQSLILAVFEAEDRMQPDTSGDHSMQDNPFFTTTDADEGSKPILTDDAVLRVDAVVTKVYAHNRIDSIEVEHLVRVQRICDVYLAAAEHGSLHVGEDWEEQDKLNWLGRIASAHSGLIAARTMMRIMAGGHSHKELQLEDHLRIVLDAVRTAVEGCVIPIVEMHSNLGDKVRGEKAAPRNPAFDIAVENRKTLQAFMQLTTKCVRLLGDLFFKTDIDETGISSLELVCKNLIFTENATTDRDAALGMQSFEELRKAAMDGLARMFEKYTSQRTFIVDEMLLSLDKLPANKQSARQFTLPDAKPIQLVSALLMRLVQTSATADPRGTAADDNEDEDDESEEEYSSDSENFAVTKNKTEKRRSAKSKNLPRDLAALYQPLQKSAQWYATYIISSLLQRALGSSKSSDEPFRRLLDIFVDDFLNVLGSTDWPAAELLLRALVRKLVDLAENAKSPAPSRTLALELLGTIGSGILDLRATAVSGGNALDTENALSARLAHVARLMKSDDMSTGALTAFEGPYRVMIDYLDARDIGTDPRLQSARGHHLMQWADFVCNGRESSVDPTSDMHSATALQFKIRRMIEDVQWLANAEPEFPKPTTEQGKLAGRLVAANSKLCNAFGRIFSVVLMSLSSEQPTVRSRSLKSVNALLEQDPSVLDRDNRVLSQIVRCLSDASSLVRDSALGLLQKCVSLLPTLDLKVYKAVVPRTKDTAVGVRKRAMAFLKQVYSRNDDNTVRAAISNALISRVDDKEESVAEVARATIEQVWFSTFSNIRTNDRSVDHQLRLSSHAALIIQTVDLGDNVAAVLEDMVKALLTSSKQASENVRISKMFVSVICDLVAQDVPGNPSQVAVMRTLNVFAKAWPKLFTPDQLSHLEPYTKNLATVDDLEVYHPVVNILRHTLPVVVGVDQEKLKSLMTALMTSVGKMPKSELAVIAPCVATIDGLLGGTERPLSLVKSVLQPLYNDRQAQTIPNPASRTAKRLAILGQFGKSCDLDLAALRAQYPWYRGDTVAGLLLEIICYFSSPRHPLVVREAAVEAICEICQFYPEHFERADVINAIEATFQAETQALEAAMLTSLEAFFAAGVTGSEEHQTAAAGIEGGAQRLGGTYKATGHDKASSALSQRFLPQFLRIALSSVDDVALTAARIVVHINTSGLSYPQDSAPSLVALETCPNHAIANLAFIAHKELFGKYESIFEKQIIKSVERAFEYQNQVVRDPKGFYGSPPVAKLHFFWDVMKTGKAKVRQKFFTNTCASMNFDPSELVLTGSGAPHLTYVRFCVENMAFIDYTSVSELLHLLSSLEKTVVGTGTEVAQAIESDILKIQVPVTSSSTMGHGDDIVAVASVEAASMPQVSHVRPEKLAVSAQILSLMWETRTYLRRVWTMQKYAGRPKSAIKDANKAPSRAANSPALTETFQTRIQGIMDQADTDEARKEMCRAFVDLYSVDSEVKVGSEDEENMDLDEDDARSESSSTKSPSAGATPRSKKRKSADSGVNGVPKKRKRRSSTSKQQKYDDDDDGGDWR